MACCPSLARLRPRGARRGRNACAHAKRSRKPSERALERQDAFREVQLLQKVPQFFEDPGFPTISGRLRRGEVLNACFVASAIVTTLGTAGSVLLPLGARALGFAWQGGAFESLQRVPNGTQALVAVGAGLAVAAARQGLASLWPRFQKAIDVRNSEVRAPSTHAL